MKTDKPPKAHSSAAIERYAERLHVLLGLRSTSYFNIITVLENELTQHLRDLTIEVLSRRELKVAAHTEFEPSRVLIREDVYEGAHQDDQKSRFTVAHEIGHLCLHPGYPMPRLPPEAPQFERNKTIGRIEGEANLFASAFLMPRAVALRYKNKPRRLADVCKVSELAARIRLSNLLFPTDELTTNNVRSLFGDDEA